MDYRESLDFLYGLQRFGIKLGLENIRALLDRLGRPDRQCRIIHVAGTNGKGSVSACLAQILREAGNRVGLYTSPHLHSFTERIRIDGVAISEAEVASLADDLRRAGEGIPATFFEFTTALALEHFRRRQVDFAVLEVGMGGRLDATNVVTPMLSVITPVSQDHGEHLGGDLGTIAAEKGGIIKPGVPVVIGPQQPEALEVLLARAQRQKAAALVFGRDYSCEAAPEGFSFDGGGLHLGGLRPSLAGAHQHQNLSVALAAAVALRQQGVAIPGAALRTGVEHVRWPGRLEWFGQPRRVLLDGAHNRDGALALASYLKGLDVPGIHWVVAIKGDKDPGHILGPLLPLVKACYCPPLPVEQGMEPSRLAHLAEGRRVPAETFASPRLALEAALARGGDREIVLVAGSLFLVGEVRQLLKTTEFDC